MQIPPIPFTVTDWKKVPETVHPGLTGEARWRTVEIETIRVRIVEYSASYTADHWCHRGHILYVLEGKLETELKDGRRMALEAGMSYQVSTNGDAPHRSSTTEGATLLVVD